MTNQAEQSEPTFEAALGQLEAIVQRLEDGQASLDESLAEYEQGVRLLKRCHALLARAERRIELLSGVDAEGRPITSPLGDEDLSLEEKAEKRTARRSRSPARKATRPASDNLPDGQGSSETEDSSKSQNMPGGQDVDDEATLF